MFRLRGALGPLYLVAPLISLLMFFCTMHLLHSHHHETITELTPSLAGHQRSRTRTLESLYSEDASFFPECDFREQPASVEVRLVTRHS